MASLPALPVARPRVLTAAELLAAGWTPTAVRRAVEAGRLLQIAAGRFAPPPPMSLTRLQVADLALARRAVAAALPVHRTGVGGLAAAWIRGSPIWALEAAHGPLGVGRARALPALLDPLSESPSESRARYRCHLHGVAPDRSQVWIRTREARLLGRVDSFWAEGLVGEADGRLEYEDDPAALSEEKRRQQGFEDVELDVVRWGARPPRLHRGRGAHPPRPRTCSSHAA